MPDRRFEIVFPVAGFIAGDVVDEEHLTGCNVDALVEGGFLRETAAAGTPTPPSPETSGG